MTAFIVAAILMGVSNRIEHELSINGLLTTVVRSTVIGAGLFWVWRATGQRAIARPPEKGHPLAELKVCPYCAEMIKQQAIKCRYCGSDLEAKAASNGSRTDGFERQQSRTKRVETGSLTDEECLRMSNYKTEQIGYYICLELENRHFAVKCADLLYVYADGASGRQAAIHAKDHGQWLPNQLVGTINVRSLGLAL